MGQNQLKRLMKERWKSFPSLSYYVTIRKTCLIKKKSPTRQCVLCTLCWLMLLLVSLLLFCTFSLCWSEMSGLSHPCTYWSLCIFSLWTNDHSFAVHLFFFFPLHFSIHDYFSVWSAVACNLHDKRLNLNNNAFQSFNQVLFAVSLYRFAKDNKIKDYW